MAPLEKLTTQQIGKLGELLVQFELLRLGIDSAPLTVDNGIDLVAYSRDRKSAKTIQVKTNLKPKPGGGKGKSSLDWWVPENSPANLFALVDLSEESIWIFTPGQLKTCAQQQPEGRLHFYMYTDPSVKRPTNAPLALVSDFDEFLFENCLGSLF